MPTIAVDKAALFEVLGKQSVLDYHKSGVGGKLIELPDTRLKSSTNYASSSVCASLGPILFSR